MASRYFFNLVSDEAIIPDEAGIELSGSDSIVPYALQAIAEIRRAAPSAAEEWEGWRIEIVDDANRVIQTISLSSKYNQANGN